MSRIACLKKPWLASEDTPATASITAFGRRPPLVDPGNFVDREDMSVGPAPSAMLRRVFERAAELLRAPTLPTLRATQRAAAERGVQQLPRAVLEALRELVVGAAEAKRVEDADVRVHVARAAAVTRGDDGKSQPLGRRVCLSGLRSTSLVASGAVPKKIADATLLGRGAFGEVYEAGGRAVKVVSLAESRWGRTCLASSLRDWRKEVRMARTCGALGVSPVVHDAFLCTHAHQVYGVMVMDLVRPAVTLQDWRANASAADVATADRLLAERLAALHGAGIAHGDLHAGNVVVVPEAPQQPSRPTASGRGRGRERGRGRGRAVQAPTPAPRYEGVRDVLIVDFGFARTFKDLQDADRITVRALGAGRQPVLDARVDDDAALDDACNAREFVALPNTVKEVMLRLVHEKVV